MEEHKRLCWKTNVKRSGWLLKWKQNMIFKIMIKQMENTQNVFVFISCLLPERKSILNLCVPNNMESKHIKAKWMNESINEIFNSTITLEDLNISLPEIYISNK